jgi:DNA-binding CsgD family transcriptional regulator
MESNHRAITNTLNTALKYILAKADSEDTGSGQEKLMESIRFLETIFPDKVIMLCRQNHSRLSYVSACCQEVFGYSEVWFRSITLEENLRMIHPDDVGEFQKCLEKMLAWKTSDHENYRFTLYYRMKTGTGGYCFVQDEKIAIRTDTGKFIFLTLLNNITREDAFTGVRVEVRQKIKDQFVPLAKFIPRQEQGNGKLSQRQQEVVKLTSQGLTNKEIAERLNVSIYTVKNHKQNLFRKTKVRNSLALINNLRPGLEQSI